jgi:DMSO/TMAO reductase YedYZ molybdopterin-dependent catalytic subunit
MTRRQAALSGFGWGLVAGLALVALMYFLAGLIGLRPLPQLLNEPLLALMPGFVFGFLIDTLQHAGKVVEELGLIVAMIAVLALGGAGSAVASLRWPSQWLPFAVAGLLWLVVVAVLLPVAGAGFLGLGDGPATPITWAALFAFYAVVLQFGGSGPSEVDLGRRRVLTSVPLGIAVASVAAIGIGLVPGWYRAIFRAAGSGLRGVSATITPVADFYVVSKNFVDPAVDGNAWNLKIGGLADRPLSLTLDQLRALPATQQYTTLECISNNVGGPQISTGDWKGVSLRDLVAMAGPQAQASWIAFKAHDGYTESLALDLVQSTPEILVAYELNGSPLPSQHGFPARILIPGHYGMKGPKWLDEIDLVQDEVKGYWEQQGWDHNAIVRTMSRFDVPVDGDIVKVGAIEVAGVAYAGTRGISKVEYSTDGGSSWNAAPFDAPLSKLTWVIWRATWTPGSHGAYTLKVRATDGSGAVQESGIASSYPSGSSGYHTIHVNVSG